MPPALSLRGSAGRGGWSSPVGWVDLAGLVAGAGGERSETEGGVRRGRGVRRGDATGGALTWSCTRSAPWT